MENGRRITRDDRSRGWGEDAGGKSDLHASKGLCGDERPTQPTDVCGKNDICVYIYTAKGALNCDYIVSCVNRGGLVALRRGPRVG